MSDARLAAANRTVAEWMGAIKTCVVCLGKGFHERHTPFQRDRCGSCNGTGQIIPDYAADPAALVRAEERFLHENENCYGHSESLGAKMWYGIRLLATEELITVNSQGQDTLGIAKVLALAEAIERSGE